MVKVPRRSSTFSEVMRGTWKSVVMSSLRMRVQKFRNSGLLGVELDDELLLDRRRDLGALGVAQDLGGEGIVIGLQPGRNGGNQFRRPLDRVGGGRPGLDRDDVLGTDLVRGDVDAAAVDHQCPWLISW